jgi:DNA mismatch repair protein MutL
MIRILPPAEARKIAAGEVIDRPAALVRELIDNALDSGASNIELNIEGGGINKVEVIDNGSGMSREDLELCTKTHATSKIQSLDDLARSTTLGFRGEALAAATAVAALEISTSMDGREAWLLHAGPSANPETASQTRRTRGTSVRVLGLFDTLPARKRFLKKESSEGALCRQIFIEKALAFPGVSFRFVQDGCLKIHLLSLDKDGLKNRFGELVLSGNEKTFLHRAESSGAGFTVIVIFGGPELYRRDRRQQYIFANKRRIQDFGLMQALEYGLAGFFPNGSHPAGAVFVELDPALADFNIHPAKREVRFADAGAIHHAVSSVLREYVSRRGITAEPHDSYGGTGPELFGGRGVHAAAGAYAADGSSGGGSAALAMDALLEKRGEFAPLPFRSEGAAHSVHETATQYNETVQNIPGSLRLVGRAFKLFIIVEKGEKLFLIDQHAAHERFLYNRFLEKKITIQELLAPIPFSVDNAGEDRFLHSKQQQLAELGILLESEGNGSWRIEALPAGWKTSDGETVEAILDLMNAGENIAERWAATLSCRAAVKDGDLLDDAAALALAEAALALPIPRCPHGRPIWLEISRDDLFKAMRRT